MANIKFSQFTVETAKADVDFLVGYSGPDNIQISPTNLLADYSQGTGAAGQVTFFSAASTVTGDNDFYWDNTNKRLGIGTASPATKLQVDSTSDFSVALSKRGSTSSALKFTLSNPNTTTNTWKIEHDASENLKIFGYSADNLLISTNSTERMRITSSGNVGINTTSPAAALHVDGTLIATGISQLGSGGTNVYLTSSSAGSVGIGTSSPAKKLHVKGSAPWIRIEEDSASNKRLDLYVNPSTAIGVIAANQSAQQLSFQTSNTDRLRITNAGNVGIGTTSPSTKLEVNGTVHLGSGGNDVTIGASNSSVIFMIRAGYNYIQASDASGAIMFRTGGGNNRMIIDSSGNVGIGTTNPSNKLTIDGVSDGINIIGASSYIRWNSGDMMIRNEGSYAMGFHTYDGSTSMVERMRINSSGNVGIGTTSPNAKLEVKGATAENTQIRIQTDGGASEVPTLLLMRNASAYGEIKYIPDGGGNQGVHITDYRTDVSNIIFNTAGANERMRIDSSGNVGIGTTSPASKLEVDGGDIEIDDSASGLILRSPDGTRYRVTVANGGTLSVSAV